MHLFHSCFTPNPYADLVQNKTLAYKALVSCRIAFLQINFDQHPWQMWRTCVVRVLQVEKRRSFLLPHLRVFVQLFLVLPEIVEGRTISRKETFLEPYLAQKDIQCDGSHHEAKIKKEFGSQDLHAGPGVSVTINLTGAELETGIIGGCSAKAPTSSSELLVLLPCWRVYLI